jgi:hypothetical protein
MIMNWKGYETEVIMAQFRILSHHLPLVTDESSKKPVRIPGVFVKI